MLSGSDSYRIHFAPGQIPAGEVLLVADRYNIQSWLVANPYNKYSVGSNKGLTYNRDGSLDVYVQPTPPAGHQSNWIPDPANTEFILILRMYDPSAGVLNGTYTYPQITRVG